MAMIRSVAVDSTRSPNNSPTWGSLLNTLTETSRESNHAEAAVCSFTNGDAILKGNNEEKYREFPNFMEVPKMLRVL